MCILYLEPKWGLHILEDVTHKKEGQPLKIEVS